MVNKDCARYVNVDPDEGKDSQYELGVQDQRKRHEADLYMSGRKGN